MKIVWQRPGSSTTQTCLVQYAYSRLFCLWKQIVDIFSVVGFLYLHLLYIKQTVSYMSGKLLINVGTHFKPVSLFQL